MSYVPSANGNPLLGFFLDDSRLPDFSAIVPDQVVPAVTQAIAGHKEAMAQCRAMPGSPELLKSKEHADLALAQTWGLVCHLVGVATNPQLRSAHQEAQALVDAHISAVGQDKVLYGALRAIHSESLSPHYQRALQIALRDFHLAGVALDEETGERFAANSLALSRLSTEFSNAVLDATESWSHDIAAREKLAGLPEADLAGMAEAASKAGLTGFRITLHAPAVTAILTHAEDRALRRLVYEAHGTRASDQGPLAGQFDNSARMREILALRAERARMLGLEDPVALSLATKMAQSGGEIEEFLLRLARLARPRAERDMSDLAGYAADKLGIAQLEPWDIAFAGERLRREEHDLDAREIRQHLPLDNVLDALFALVEELFGIELRESSPPAAWHEDVRLYEVVEQDAASDARPLAAFYTDLFAREGKRGGAWMDSCRTRRDGAGSWPVAHLVTNFAPPSGTGPALLTHEDMVTLFHEMGHVLHHVLSAIDVPSISGISGVEWDAVELPSQFLENFAWEPAVLRRASAHAETGAPLSDQVIERMLAARHFLRAPALLRQIEYALFDLRIHRAAAHGEVDVEATLASVRDAVAVVRPPQWHRFANAFSHVFAGGYAAGYYSYLWAERLACDAYAAFGEASPGNESEDNSTSEGTTSSARGVLGARFRDEVLSRGGSRPALDNFVAFRGRNAIDEALLASWGIAA